MRMPGQVISMISAPESKDDVDGASDHSSIREKLKGFWGRAKAKAKERWEELKATAHHLKKNAKSVLQLLGEPARGVIEKANDSIHKGINVVSKHAGPKMKHLFGRGGTDSTEDTTEQNAPHLEEPNGGGLPAVEKLPADEWLKKKFFGEGLFLRSEGADDASGETGDPCGARASSLPARLPDGARSASYDTGRGT